MMAFNSYFSITISILISLLLVSPINGHANSPSHFDSKAYLKRYGYLEYARANISQNDEEPDEARIIESAIKTFQENFHIKPTGVLDFETLATMNIPRCGVPDFINGTNSMQARSSSKYTTYPGDHFKWRKKTLSYAPSEGFPEAAKFPLELAFTEWQSISNFTFSEIEGMSAPGDMPIGFYSGDRGYGVAFDGPGGVMGYGGPPEQCFADFDADENWCFDSTKGIPSDGLDFESAALHEIGHMLGLGHSSVELAVMYPFMGYGVSKTKFDDDDIQGMRILYG